MPVKLPVWIRVGSGQEHYAGDIVLDSLTAVAPTAQFFRALADRIEPSSGVSSQCQMGYHDQCETQLRATGQSCGCPRHAGPAGLCAGDIRRIEVRGDARR